DEPETAGAGSSGIECAAQSGELVVAPDERSRLCGKPISAAHGVLTGSAHVDGLCHRYRRFRRRPSTQLRCLQSSRATKEIQTDSRAPRIAMRRTAPLGAAAGSFASPRRRGLKVRSAIAMTKCGGTRMKRNVLVAG